MRSRRHEYFMPFVTLIGIILAIVFFSRAVIFFFFTDEDRKPRFFISDTFGKVEMMQWGKKSYSIAQTGQEILTGDKMRTLQGRAVLSYADKTSLRLGENTILTLSDYSPFDETQGVFHVVLEQGTVWVTTRTAFDSLRFQVDSFLLVPTESSIFQIYRHENGVNFDLFEGNIALSYFSGVHPVVEFSLPGGVGVSFQPSDLTNIILGIKQYDEFLRPFNQTIIQSEWGKWNRELDQDRIVDIPVFDLNRSQLAILSPSSGSSVSEDTIEIYGIAPEGTEVIIVYANTDEAKEGYSLRRYKAGDLTWRYVVSKENGNLFEGENIFEFVAIDSQGKEIAREKFSLIKK